MYNLKPKISIIICTYNRWSLLSTAIESLLDQNIDPTQFEIIVVDNNSSDETKSLVSRFQETSQVKIIYRWEEKQGSGIARYSGSMVANGEYYGFIDDDAKVPQNFLANAIDIVTQNDEYELLAFGGKILPYYLAPPPAWFKDKYETRTWGEYQRWLVKGEALSGSNMFFRKDVYQRVQLENAVAGMVGDIIGFGEDTILFEKIFDYYDSVKKKILYSPSLIVYHAVPPHKMSVKYHLQRQFSIGKSNYARYRPDTFLPRFWFNLKQLLWFFLLILNSLIKLFSCPNIHPWAMETLGPVSKRLGMLSMWFR